MVPIGATMHMDGSVLSAILKISFLFGIFNMEFTGIGTYLTAICVAVLSGVAMSGIPGGGLIGEMLIVSLYGFPPEAFPIIAMIGFLVDPPCYHDQLQRRYHCRHVGHPHRGGQGLGWKNARQHRDPISQ